MSKWAKIIMNSGNTILWHYQLFIYHILLINNNLVKFPFDIKLIEYFRFFFLQHLQTFSRNLESSLSTDK